MDVDLEGEGGDEGPGEEDGSLKLQDGGDTELHRNLLEELSPDSTCV